jgi:uridine kinase
MRVALLISGYLRTFNSNINSLNDKILSKFDNIDIYLHITEEESIDDKYLNNISLKNICDIKSILKPKVIIEEKNILFSEKNRENNVSNTWSKYFKLNQIKKINEKKFGKYDMVIKFRPDMNIISDIDFNNFENGCIYIPKDSKIDKSKLKNINDNYICDIFAYGDSESMDLYLSIYDNLNKLFKYSDVSETMLFKHLTDSNINYKLINIDYTMILSMCNVFAICGDSGSGKTTIGKILKKHFSNSFMLECDRYHKWERGNENWNNITHLNPDANYISKMNEDIFNLKIGKSIYQVDYNHSTGKFTDSEKIDSSDNIIVCGLHSLYSKNDSVFDLKIFMDTNRELKYSWKIKRDIKERGYSLDKILNQIKSREDDYLKYIYPQRDESDIIINFTTNDKFDLSDIDRTLSVYLNIYFSKKINIINIVNSFINNNIEMYLSDEDNFNKITFTDYKNCELFNKTGLNSFYDYIMYIILNIKKN